MIINLIKAKQMFSLTLPSKIKGQYWLSDTNEKNQPRDLISIEAIDGEWVLKSNRQVEILNSNNEVIDSMVLYPQIFLNLKIKNSTERVILFSESIDENRQTLKKYFIKNNDSFTIGRSDECNICYNNKFVSGHHANLSYNNSVWKLVDTQSTNGTYVNGRRIESTELLPGDFIYIMGLKIVVGYNYLAINNPDTLLELKSNNLFEYTPQEVDDNTENAEIPSKKYFYRSPRFYREVDHVEIKIDPPPQLQKMDTVPLALMLGPSITMGMTSMSTGILSLTNVLSNGGEITQALPSLLMSVSMLLGTVLWPILTKKYEKKTKIKNEQKRQEKYLAYLDSIRDEIKRKSKEQREIIEKNIVSLENCSNRIAQEEANLWERSLGQDDFLRLRLGIGDLPLDAEIKYPEKKFTMEDDNLQDAMFSLGSEPKQLSNIPVSVSLVKNMIVGIFGNVDKRVNLLKSLLLQMVSLHSYDELKIILVCDESDKKEWDFVRFIPHFWTDDKSMRFYATNVDEEKEISAYVEKNLLNRIDSDNADYSELNPYYVFISTNKNSCEKCDALQQLLKYKNNVGFSILLAAETIQDLPKETNFVISVNENEAKMFDRTDTSGRNVCFNLDKMNPAIVENAAQDIANIELDLSTQRYTLPTMITFLEMFNVGKIEHLNSLTRWKENNPTLTLQTPIGVDTMGNAFNLDLHEKFHGPHGLVAGMTGSGKSEFIITYILSLAVNYHPDEVAFILIDYKGGGLAGAFEDIDRGIKLPHLAGTITNLDGAAVNRSLISIQSELRRRQAIFNEARKIANEGTMDIYKYQQLYRDKVVSEPVPHLFIIADEFAELKVQQPEFMEQLISAARIGRSLGVHLILATQKPNGVVDDQIWSNSKFRVCLKVQEKADSQDMIKCADAAEISQTGRFYLQVGFNELFALGQSAWCGAEYVSSETVEKKIDSSIQVVDNLGRVLMNVKPSTKKKKNNSKIKQIVAIVKYLSDLASEENISTRPLWLAPIPARIFIENLENKYGVQSKDTVLNPIIGEYDDPFNQKKNVLTVPFSKEGNCLVYGSAGNGKTTFLTTLCYSLIKNHTAEELNIYIMDFGSETLKVFEKAPHVGGVIISSDEEKTINFVKMLHKEIDKRKSLFSDYGGDYTSYCKNSNQIMPNIVVIINNFSGFAEQFEELQEMFSLLSRDCVKYGIYFVVTASNTNAVRYKTQQNFKMMFTMQQNDATDYQLVVGKTDGLIPSKYKGRGLVALDKAYEFQTAYCKDTEDQHEFLRKYCSELREGAVKFAKPIPVLPSIVTIDSVHSEINSLKGVPVGVNKKTLEIEKIDLMNKVVFPIATQEVYDAVYFSEEFIKVISNIKNVNISVIDSEKALYKSMKSNVSVITDNFNELIEEIFKDMVNRNNTYKDNKMDLSSLNGFDEKVYILFGLKRFYEQLTREGKDKFKILIEKAESFYKIHFIMIESLTYFNEINYEAWYKRHVTGGDGLWIGDGIADQYVFKINKITTELYEEIGSEYGYVLKRNRYSLAKLLSSALNEEI